MSTLDIPDDVPVDDVAEQRHDVIVDTETGPSGSGGPSLDSDPSDWQEQQEVVVDDPDEMR